LANPPAALGVVARNRCRTIGGAIGSVGGTASGAADAMTGAQRGARSGALIGLSQEPVGITISSLAGAIMAGQAG